MINKNQIEKIKKDIYTKRHFVYHLSIYIDSIKDYKKDTLYFSIAATNLEEYSFNEDFYKIKKER